MSVCLSLRLSDTSSLIRLLTDEKLRDCKAKQSWESCQITLLASAVIQLVATSVRFMLVRVRNVADWRTCKMRLNIFCLIGSNQAKVIMRSCWLHLLSLHHIRRGRRQIDLVTSPRETHVAVGWESTGRLAAEREVDGAEGP